MMQPSIFSQTPRGSTPRCRFRSSAFCVVPIISASLRSYTLSTAGIDGSSGVSNFLVGITTSVRVYAGLSGASFAFSNLINRLRESLVQPFSFTRYVAGL